MTGVDVPNPPPRKPRAKKAVAAKAPPRTRGKAASAAAPPVNGHAPPGIRTALHEIESPGPVWHDDDLYFSPFDLSRYRLAETELAHTISAVHLKKHELKDEHTRHDSEVKRIQFEIAQLQAESTRRKEALEALRDDMQKAYPVKFTDITFDDQTGKIMIHGQPVKRE